MKCLLLLVILGNVFRIPISFAQEISGQFRAAV